ncbi:hypothetical protein AB669_05630 [Pedobacter sp. BMA]|nr:hypothetical protein AB669_05630 [Pedobacter sp. BMA]
MEQSIKQIFVKYIQNEASQSEIEQVLSLMQSDKYATEWEAAMVEFQSGFETRGEELGLPNQDQLYQNIKQRTVNKPRRSPQWQWIGYAAAILVVCATAWWTVQPHEASNQIVKQAIAQSGPEKPSGRKWVKLPDGTSVQLNVNSHLDYPDTFEGKQNREVTLVGEAFFDVAHDSKHPFIIHTGKIKTTVLGTAFNISAYDNEKSVTVTVTRGKVMVQRAQQTLAILTPDQQISWHASEKTQSKININAEEAIAWKAQDLIMDDISLAKAADMIAGRFKVKVVFKTDQVKDCRFTAAFLNRNDLSQVTEVLSSITGASFELKGNQLFIDGPGCTN